MVDPRNRIRWALAGGTLTAAAAVAVVVAVGGDGGESRPAPQTEAAPNENGSDDGGPLEAERAAPPVVPLARTADAARCGAPSDATVHGARAPRNHCVWTFANDLAAPRGIFVDGTGQILVVERGEERITALLDRDGDRVSSEDERAVLARAPGLNHGITVHGDHLYASSATTVFRWPYEAGETDALGEPEVVVRGMPDGGHDTRTLVTDDADRLYVSVGSRGNVDRDSSRARILRFQMGALPEGGFDWPDGELFADGLRNEVALGFDGEGRLWGAQNGSDNLARDDLGGDIHADNPAEDLDRFDEPGRFYGYPYCWTEYELPEHGRGRGTQWAHPDFMDDGVHDDAWCRDTDHVVRPELAMQAHAAPLDLMFWEGGALPDALEGDALISFHGSWNRPEPTGYKVVRIVFHEGDPVRVDPLVEHAGHGDKGDDWPHRPVGLARGPEGALLVTSDATGQLLALAAEQR
ncbi:MAG: PQQ-dependent sugar dehydrogenase [Myxococcota bacterium]